MSVPNRVVWTAAATTMSTPGEHSPGERSPSPISEGSNDGMHALFDDEDEPPWESSAAEYGLMNLPNLERGPTQREVECRDAADRLAEQRRCCESCERPTDGVSVADKATRLMKWATKHGARLGECTVAPSQYGGLGVIATGHVRHGDVLLTIPRKLVVTHDRCHDAEATRAGAVLRALSTPIFTSLIVFLLAELEDPTSFYHEWIASLPGPAELHNAPYMGLEELGRREAEALESGEGSDADKVWRAVAGVRDKLRASQQYIEENLTSPLPEAFPSHASPAPEGTEKVPPRSPESFDRDSVEAMVGPWDIREAAFGREKQRWAGAVILSRAFEVNGHTVVLPLIDALNHDPKLGGSLRWNANGEFEVVSGAAYEPGQEVFLSYGPPEKMGNDNLIATYGFAL